MVWVLWVDEARKLCRFSERAVRVSDSRCIDIGQVTETSSRVNAIVHLVAESGHGPGSSLGPSPHSPLPPPAPDAQIQWDYHCVEAHEREANC